MTAVEYVLIGLAVVLASVLILYLFARLEQTHQIAQRIEARLVPRATSEQLLLAEASTLHTIQEQLLPQLEKTLSPR